MLDLLIETGGGERASFLWRFMPPNRLVVCCLMGYFGGILGILRAGGGGGGGGRGAEEP
jgi:hypothetical protein